MSIIAHRGPRFGALVHDCLERIERIFSNSFNVAVPRVYFGLVTIGGGRRVGAAALHPPAPRVP